MTWITALGRSMIFEERLLLSNRLSGRKYCAMDETGRNRHPSKRTDGAHA
jgi:hypothetical protein